MQGCFLEMPRPRTTLLPASLENAEACIPWSLSSITLTAQGIPNNACRQFLSCHVYKTDSLAASSLPRTLRSQFVAPSTPSDTQWRPNNTGYCSLPNNMGLWPLRGIFVSFGCPSPTITCPPNNNVPFGLGRRAFTPSQSP